MDNYHFKVGAFDCLSINEAYHSYPVEGFFEGTPVELVRQALQARGEPGEQITLAYGIIYANTGANKILVDTGLGALGDDPGLLTRALLAYGVRPEDIDSIIITHAHGDHIGGLLDGQGQMVYPNAVIYSCQSEWEFWLANPHAVQLWGTETVERTRSLFRRIAPALRWVEPGMEFLAGVSAVDAHGHTPGLISVRFDSEKERLLCISDLVFDPLQLEHPDWLPEPIFMVEPEAYLESKRRILNLAADQDMLVHAMHFAPAPSLGWVSKKGSAWSWKPI